MAMFSGGQSSADIRDYLAEERTFLAWIRTGLASMGFGFVVARFGLYLAEIHGVAAPSDRFSVWSGTAFIAVGVAVNLLSTWRHLRVVEELNRGQLADLRRPSQEAVVLALFLALVGVAMALYLALA
jgi:inner membrane protein YidH